MLLPLLAALAVGLVAASVFAGQPAAPVEAAARPLRAPAAVQQGGSVTIIGHGPGFQVSNTGRALNSAAPGETVRVRLPNNQVVTGTVRTDGAVEVAY